jgi:hypothetical protein
VLTAAPRPLEREARRNPGGTIGCAKRFRAASPLRRRFFRAPLLGRVWSALASGLSALCVQAHKGLMGSLAVHVLRTRCCLSAQWLRQYALHPFFEVGSRANGGDGRYTKRPTLSFSSQRIVIVFDQWLSSPIFKSNQSFSVPHSAQWPSFSYQSSRPADAGHSSSKPSCRRLA